MKKYVEFYDKENGYIKAVDELNKFVAENESLKVSVIGYQVVKGGQSYTERAFILAEVEE